MSLRLIRHFFAVAGGQVLNLVGTLLLAPLFLKHWSPLLYGEWLALSGLTAYLSTLDLGMNSAVSNRLLAAYVRKDQAEYMRCQHSAAAFYLSLAVGGTLLSLLVFWLLPVASWIGIKPTAVPDASWILWLLALQVLWMMPVGLLGNFYATVENPAKSKWLNNAKAAAFLVMTILGLLLGCRMRTMALLQLVPIVAVAGYVLLDMRLHYPKFLPGLRRANLGTIRELLKPSLLFALIMVAMSLTQQAPALAVSAILGGVAVAILSTARSLTNLAMQIVRMISNTAWPDLTILYAREDFARLRLLNRLIVSTSVTVCIAIASALWFEGTDVFRVWTKGQLPLDQTFFRLLLLYLIFQSPWLANTAVTGATNKHQNQAWALIASGLISLAAIIVLLPRIGLNAVPISLMLGELLACYHFLIRDTCQVIGEHYPRTALKTWLSLTVILLPTLAVGWAVHQFAWGPSPLRWMEVGSGTLITAAVISWLVWMGPEERAVIGNKARLLTARFRPRVRAEQCA